MTDIQIIDIQELADFSYSDPEGTAVIMPSTNRDKAVKTAKILHRRAGMPCKILVVMDKIHQGFIKTLNQTAVRIKVKYIVYLAQDAWPGRNWLKYAHDTLEKSGKGLLAFNDGKWQGRIASFGMVRIRWVKNLYNGFIFYPGYRSHAADNELTVIARANNTHEYNPDCTLLEYDPDKDFGGSNPDDRALFEERFQKGFEGLTTFDKLEALASEYKVKWQNEAPETNDGVSIIILTLNASGHLDPLLSSFFSVNTMSPVELLVIDHGSTDNTAQIIAKYAYRGFVRLVRREQNHSFSSSCNLGAEKAKYSYLLFMNNDIIYTSDVLPEAVKKLQNRNIGGVGVRLEDTPAFLPPGKEPGVQHAGIHFTWNEKRGYFQPEQIRYPRANGQAYQSGTFPAVTAAFMLCRKSDFNKLGGFSTEYDYGLEDMDFCLRLNRDLNKSCWCINDMSLQHVDGATRKKGDKEARSATIEKNHRIFKKKWDGYIRKLLEKKPAITRTSDPQTPVKKPSPSAVSALAPRSGKDFLNILFVLPASTDSNNGYQLQLLSGMLHSRGAECIIAAPQAPDIQSAGCHAPTRSYDKILTSDFQLFSDKRGPDIIYAWTPRENVRRFCEKLLQKHPCPLVIHLEDNEEYLTEATVGRAFAELSALPEKKQDQLIPENRFHPVKGRRFLKQAHGLTMIIDTLDRFNPGNLPSLSLCPPVDERLFYPRPLNLDLRRKLDIPKKNIVLAYTGNVHTGNREEVLELYKAVNLLCEEGFPTTLIRTGKNVAALTHGDNSWINKFEKPLGWVKRKELPDILAAADMFVQPGEPGPFNDQRIPCKLPEYFAMGRPVILPKSNLGLKAEHGKEAYVLDKAAANEIFHAVQEIFSDKSLSGTLAMGAAAFSRTTVINPDPNKIYKFISSFL